MPPTKLSTSATIAVRLLRLDELQRSISVSTAAPLPAFPRGPFDRRVNRDCEVDGVERFMGRVS